MTPAPKGEPISREEQIERWVRGDAVHRANTLELTDKDGNVAHLDGGECTPDFACCKPALLVDFDIRRAYAAATERDRVAFLGGFMGAAIALYAEETGTEPKVHIGGQDPLKEN
jgi:hypothetical protein